MSDSSTSSRVDCLDATRAFALVLGIVFHASLSFLPIFIGWAVQDISTSPAVEVFSIVSHSFRMETFFLLAGFFGYVTVQRRGADGFIRSRVLHIVVPFVLGWFILRPLIVSGWIMGSASLRGDYDFWAGLRIGFESLRTLPAGIFTASHLWFLYYLAIISGLVVFLRAVLRATGPWAGTLRGRADALIAWLASSRWCFPILLAPTAFALWFMQYWGVDTPDKTLSPHLPVLALYGGFFVFGWMLSRQPALLPRFARLSPQYVTAAVIGVVSTVRLGRFQTDPSHPYYLAAHVGFVISYALMMWALVLVTIGFFQRFCSRPNRVIRYIADASYWLYLTHLPIVVWLQVAFAELPLHWSFKLIAISAITIAVLLLSYDLFVRSTFLGQLLNGRRRPRVLFAWPSRPRLAEA
jgi:glucans biosynthesis protein C